MNIYIYTYKTYLTIDLLNIKNNIKYLYTYII